MFNRSIIAFILSFRLSRSWFALLLCIIFTSHSQAIAGSIISASQNIDSFAVQPNGQIVVCEFPGFGRFSADGSLDFFVDHAAQFTQVGFDNAGSTWLRSSSRLHRFNLDGIEDVHASFLSLYEFALQPDGKILVLTNGFARLNPDLTTDLSFHSEVPARGPFALQTDGKILLVSGTNLFRLNSDGTKDTSFRTPPFSGLSITKMVSTPDGKILVAQSRQQELPGLMRLNSDGSLDSSFVLSNPPSPFIIHDMAPQSDGRLIVVGFFGTQNPLGGTNILRINSDGSFDSSLAVQIIIKANIVPTHLALEEDGNFLVSSSSTLFRFANTYAGSQTLSRNGSVVTWLRSGSLPEIFAARVDASTNGVAWSELGFAIPIPGGWRLENVTAPPGALLRARGYVSGTSSFFDFAPGAPAITAISPNSTNNAGANVILRAWLDGVEPFSIQWFKDGIALPLGHAPTLQLANVSGADSGAYTLLISNSVGSSASLPVIVTIADPVLLVPPLPLWLRSGQQLSLKASAAGTDLAYQWEKDGVPIPGATMPSYLVPSASAANSGTYVLLVTGKYGGVRSAPVAVHVNELLPDGWRVPHEPNTGWQPILAMVSFRNDVIIGGGFKLLADPFRQNLVKVRSDGSIDAAFAPGPSDRVNALAVTETEQLLVGGAFQNIVGQPRPYLARLNLDGKLDPSFNSTLGSADGPSRIDALEIQPDGRILVAGVFDTINGVARPRLARLLPDGSLDRSFAPDPISLPQEPYGIVVQLDGKIIVYGWTLRRFNSDGSLDATFNPPLDNLGSISTVSLLSNGQLLINYQPHGPWMDTIRVNDDGVLDPTLPISVKEGILLGLQANGKLFSLKSPDNSPYILFRYDQLGNEDPAVSAILDSFSNGLLFDPKGDVILAGAFQTISGIPSARIERLRNPDRPLQSLSSDGKSILWMRGGSLPEVNRTSFEFSTNGLAWTKIGQGARVPGGWQKTGLQLNAPGLLRARGYVAGSIYEETAPFPSPLGLSVASYRATTGEILMTGWGFPGAPFALEQSVNLKDWTPLRTNTFETAPSSLTVTNPSSHHSFYRLRGIP